MIVLFDNESSSRYIRSCTEVMKQKYVASGSGKVSDRGKD